MNETNTPFQPEFPVVDVEAWRAVVERDLKGAPFDKRLVTRLYEGIAVQPLYTRRDWPAQEDPSGMPGQAPLTRGSASFRQGWMPMQSYRHPSPTATAREITHELDRGVQALWLHLAAPTRQGRPLTDSTDDTLARDGLLIDTMHDLDEALQGVRLELVPVALEAGSSFFGAAAQLVGLAKSRGAALSEVDFAFNADPLGTLAQWGECPRSFDAQLAELAELARYADSHLPKCRSVAVSTLPSNAAGANAVQEVAAALSTAVTYLRAMERAGLSPQRAARQIEFQVAVGCDQFLEIAKLRALRKAWNTVLEACAVPAADRCLRVHAVTAERVLSQRDPWVNLLRSTVSCFAAAVGGADAITVAPFDQAIGLPDDLARRVARNTQIVLGEESHLARVMDPAGGCWYVEHLTDELADSAWREFQRLEKSGGWLAALRDGSWLEAIDTVRAAREVNIARRKDPLTGVSEFPSVEQPRVERPPPDIASELGKLREHTTPRAAEEQLSVLRGAAAGSRFNQAVESATAGATLGELTHALKTDSGESLEPLVLHRFAASYEALRDASDAHLERHGQRPIAFLVNLGSVAEHTARATFARNFFEAGGFEIQQSPAGVDAAQAAAAFERSGAQLAIICSTDDNYASLVPTVAPALAAAGAKQIVLAGRPGDAESGFRAAGVTQFIFIGCNVLTTLKELLQAQGVLK